MLSSVCLKADLKNTWSGVLKGELLLCTVADSEIGVGISGMFNHLKGDTQPPPLLPPFQLVHAESVMQPEVIYKWHCVHYFSKDSLYTWKIAAALCTQMLCASIAYCTSLLKGKGIHHAFRIGPSLCTFTVLYSTQKTSSESCEYTTLKLRTFWSTGKYLANH